MSMMISGIGPNAARSYEAAGVKEPPQARQAEAESSDRSRAPVTDRYVPGDRAERCTANTDQVDREIRRLREQKKALERQLRSRTDGAEIRELERRLARVERELAQKDNDAYRRRHAVFS